MKKRRSSSIFGRIYNDIIRASNGEIRFTSCCFVFNPTSAQIKRSIQRNPHLPLVEKDVTGNNKYLVAVRGVTCSNHNVCAGKFPQCKATGRWSVPATFCKKCTHYRGRGDDGLKYPHCDWLRRINGGVDGALEKISNSICASVDTVNKLIGSGGER
jgi:hypothetical protein